MHPSPSPLVVPSSVARPLLTASLALTLALAALGLAGCSGGGGGGGGGGPTGPGDILTLVAQPASIQPFGTSRLVVTARSGDGTPRVAARVNLSTDLGALDATSLQTDADGAAETFLRGQGAVGSATVQAQLDSGVTTSVTVQIGGAGRALELRATPTTIASNGVATLTLRALEADGSVIPNARIDLETTLGRLDAPQLVTDAAGGAATALRGDGATGTATVTATLTDDGTEAVVDVQISDDRRLSLSASPRRIASDGGESALSVQVTNADGSPAGAGIQVELQTSLGRLSETNPGTDSFGLATSRLAADGALGIATVTATADGADSTSTEVVLGADLLLTVTTEQATIVAGGTSSISARVTRSDGAPVSGLTVGFATTRGSLGASSDTTGPNGVARTVLRSSSDDPGTAIVTARLEELEIERSITILIQ